MSLSSEVSMTMGPAKRGRRSRHRERPSCPGSMMSSSTRSGCSARALSSARSPRVSSSTSMSWRPSQLLMSWPISIVFNKQNAWHGGVVPRSWREWACRQHNGCVRALHRDN